MTLFTVYLFFITFLTSNAGLLEDISAMPDLTLFYQQLIRQPTLIKIFQDAIAQSQQQGSSSDFTIFAPSNEAMANLLRRNEDPEFLWRYHIVPGRYDDVTIYNMAQEKYTQANPRLMSNVRPQNNLPTLAAPFQLFYGSGFFAGLGPYINVNPDNAATGAGAIPWASQKQLNLTNTFDNSVPLNPFLSNLNNYDPNQHSQTYVVAQGSASSGNPSLFPQNLTNYYANVFNPNVNTQFLQNANPPVTNFNPNLPPGQVPYTNIGVPRPTINNAFVLQSRLVSRGIVNVIDNILWPPARRDAVMYKTAYDALEDAQFSRLRLLAQRSEYFRSELTSMNHQTWFLPSDQAFASIGSGLSFLFDQSGVDNINDVNDFIKSHILPLVIFPNAMDASKQISTISLGKWVTFRKLALTNEAYQIDVVSQRQLARIISTRAEDVKFYGNGVVYTIPVILSGPTRSAADELARSYQYFMSLIQQSGDAELVNILQGNTAGLGNTGPNIFNPQNLLSITVLIPQQITGQQMGSSQDLSRNLRRHILRFPVFTDQLRLLPVPAIPPGMPLGPFQRSGGASNNNLPRRHRRHLRRRRRQLNTPMDVNFQQQQQFPPIQQQPQQFLPIQQQQQQQFLPIQQQQQPQQFLPIQQQQQQQPQQILPIQQQQQQQQAQPQQFVPIQQQLQQQQQVLPSQQQQLNPVLNPSYYQMPSYPSSGIFQDGQFYPTMDPSFSIQAQVSSGPTGNMVTLVGRPENSLPFTASILNTESNIPIKNGVMHVVRGIVSGSVIPLDTVLSSLQGTNSFTQLLQQTGVIEQLKQSGRSYTLFIPTNTALQSIGVSNDINRIRRFVLRHVCADVLLDPMANVVRRTDGYLNRNQMAPRTQQQQPPPSTAQGRPRRKRQGWADAWNNASVSVSGQIIRAPDLGPGYFQPQQQVYGGYPAAPSPFSFYNQLYNPAYVMSGYANPNSQYYPGYNGTYWGPDGFNYQGLGVPGQAMSMFYSPQITVLPIPGAMNPYINPGVPSGGSNYAVGPQSCMSMTGERITVQLMPGTQPAGVNQPIFYQNFVVTCCGDQSVNSMVQSFNVYPPSFAVYVIGRSLLSQSQTINTMYSQSIMLIPSQSAFFLSLLCFLLIKYL